jgi:hypothetical protein
MGGPRLWQFDFDDDPFLKTPHSWWPDYAVF